MREQALLKYVRELGGHLWIENGQLHYRVPKVHSHELLELIKGGKSDLITALNGAETEDERRAKAILNLNKISIGDNWLPLRVERMWRTEFEKNGDAPSIPFDISFSVLLEKGTDVDLFIESVYAAVSKHEALRTRLAVVGSRPKQVIAESASAVDIKVISIPGSVKSNPDAVRMASSQILYPPIQIRRENAFRARIFRDDEGNTVFGAVLHHYVCDYWSTRILMNEIRRYYALRSRGESPPLSPNVFQYTEYTYVQRRTVLENLPAYLFHWKKSVGGITSARLPYDHIRKTDQMEPLFYVVRPDLVSSLRRTALSLRVSLFVVLLAGFLILLSRWTRHNEVITAISVADRVDSRYSTVFGYLITALPIASRIVDDEKISDFIKRLSVLLEAGYAYKELSYELYEDVFSPATPFCTTLFNYIPVDRLTPEISEADYGKDRDKMLFLSGPAFLRQMHHREIYFELVELVVGIRGRIYFNTDYFTRQSMEFLVQHYLNILEAFAENSSVKCKEVR